MFLRNVGEILSTTRPQVSEFSALHTKIPLLSLLGQQSLTIAMWILKLLY
jgi:hypothetical protein